MAFRKTRTGGSHENRNFGRGQRRHSTRQFLGAPPARDHVWFARSGHRQRHQPLRDRSGSGGIRRHGRPRIAVVGRARRFAFVAAGRQNRRRLHKHARPNPGIEWRPLLRRRGSAVPRTRSKAGQGIQHHGRKQYGESQLPGQSAGDVLLFERRIGHGVAAGTRRIGDRAGSAKL